MKEKRRGGGNVKLIAVGEGKNRERRKKEREKKNVEAASSLRYALTRFRHSK